MIIPKMKISVKARIAVVYTLIQRHRY